MPESPTHSGNIDLHGIPSRIAGRARLSADDVVHAGSELGDITAVVNASRPGRLDVAITTTGAGVVHFPSQRNP